MFSGRPIIGIAGGIGSGKSFVADVFGELGCLVIHSDELIRDAYDEPAVKDVLRQWWGDSVFHADGPINRKAIATRVFSDPQERLRLEQLLHPMVERARVRLMDAAAQNPQVLAFVWDTPLLFEAGLYRQCDSIVFVEAGADARTARLRQARGWEEAERTRRENLQWPLDKKREMSEYVIDNTAHADDARRQVRDVFSRILAQRQSAAQPGPTG